MFEMLENRLINSSRNKSQRKLEKYLELIDTKPILSSKNKKNTVPMQAGIP